MKSSLFLALALGAVTAGCSATPRVLIAQADNAKIAQVQAGTLKEANASWWGFDKADATACLQAAIDSKVPTLIVDNTGSDWIINKPLQLVSNQEIVFADGVVVQAKEGAFKGKNDSLFSGKNLTNITLRGAGRSPERAVLRMRKKDYQDPKKYERAEWRMGISLHDCSDVTIRNFTVTQTGGDGLYLGASSKGTNKNVLVEDMNFDANHRLGMAVISAENLTIRRTRFTNTLGTGPNGGIDFEPNYPGQRLVNCVLEDCVFTGNTKGSGIDIYTVNLNGDSLPISITVNRGIISGNSVGLASTITRSTTNPATGTVTFNDCRFDHNAIRLRNALTGSAQHSFKNCTLDFSDSSNKKLAAWESTPIMLTTDIPTGERAVGGIAFDHTTVIAGNEQAPIDTNFRGKTRISDQIAGTLLVQRDGQTTPFDLAAFVRQTQANLQKLNEQKSPVIALDELRAPEKGEPRAGNKEFYLQGQFTFLQYAEKGEEVTINVTVRKVYPRETTVDLIAPDGQKLQSYVLPLTNKPFPITFTAAQTGLYRVVREQKFSQRVDITSARPGNGLLCDGALQFLPIQGRLYFQVPAGVQKFSIGVATDTTADVALLDASGKEVEKRNNVSSIQLFSGTRADASQSEIWSLEVSKAVWVVTVSMYAPLAPVVSTNPRTLLLAPVVQP